VENKKIVPGKLANFLEAFFHILAVLLLLGPFFFGLIIELLGAVLKKQIIIPHFLDIAVGCMIGSIFVAIFANAAEHPE